jgi:hypothetical protein
MAGVKFMVVYPRSQDIDRFEHLYQDEDVPIGDGLSSEYVATFEAFEKLYQEEHVPMILDKLVGKRTTRVVGTSNETRPPFCRIAEVYFPSLQVLQARVRSDGGRETVAHAIKISSGGTPLVAEELTLGDPSVWDRLKALVSPR